MTQHVWRRDGGATTRRESDTNDRRPRVPGEERNPSSFVCLISSYKLPAESFRQQRKLRDNDPGCVCDTSNNVDAAWPRSPGSEEIK